uniref:Uncharacterized protein n=1 Tax=Alexandrium monilatum TaxID=311494 RepID=A0A7S4VAC7_9DINO
MDNYLVVGTLLLGYPVRFFCEGRPEHGSLWPSWLVWFWSVANMGAFMYLALSMWLAMHASIASHSFGVRMLTQFVRLPVATRQELDASTAKAEDYEELQLRDMVRLPLLKQQLRRLNAAMANDTAAQPERDGDAGDEPNVPEPGESSAMVCRPERTVDLEHIVLYRHAQENWQAYDAYARVCMAMGTNQLLYALTFYCLGVFVVEVQAPFTALCVTVLLQVSALLVVMLDVYDAKRQSTLVVAVALIFCQWLFTWVGTICHVINVNRMRRLAKLSVPLGYLMHGGWVAFMLLLAKPQQSERVALPAKFRAVLYLDVFGWLCGPRPSGPDGSRPGGGEALPPQQLRDSLCQLCRRLQLELRRDLACWEGQDVADERTLERVEVLRERLQAGSAELERVGAGSQEPPQQGAGPSAAQRTWLKLELSTAGRTVDFFLDSSTGDVRCTPPQATDRILDLASLERQLEMFEEKVRALTRFGPITQPRAPADDLPHPLPRADSGSSSACQSVLTGLGGAASSTGNVGEQRGAVQLTQDDRRAELLAPAPETAATFNPLGGRGSAESEGSRKRRPPGHMPWRTFLTGTVVLMAVWLAGAAWSSVLVLLHRSHAIDIVPSATQLSTWRRDAALGLEVVETGPLPHPFLRPTGLTCHPALGPVMFLSEKYDVHELHLGRRGDRFWRPALRGCLEEHAAFAADGIRGVQLECSPLGLPGSGCAMLLLGANGSSALRCSLGPHSPAGGSGERNLTGSSASQASAHWLLHGGPWRSLVTSSGGAMWALGEASLVQMQLRLGFQDELVPQLVLPHEVPRGVETLHLLGSGTVVGLESGRRLHAWGRDGGPPKSWRLPATHQWSGLCADNRSLYLLSTATTDGSVVLWRTDLLSDPDAM